MTYTHRRQLLASQMRLLRYVVAAGRALDPSELLPLVGGSWRRLVGTLGVLDDRRLIRIVSGAVLATRDARRLVEAAS